MTDRLEEFSDALNLMDAASRLLSADECPFDVAAHLDFAVRRLADHVTSIGGVAEVKDVGGHWIN